MSSVLDDLRAYEKRVTDRLAELRPLVDEYKELEQLARRLGLDAAPARPSRSRDTASSTPRKGRAQATRQRGRRRVQRRDEVLELVRKQPGITVPDIAKAIGVDPTGLYRVVRKLEDEGVIAKDGMKLIPAA